MLVETNLAWKIIKAWDDRPDLEELLDSGELRLSIISTISEEAYASDAADSIVVLLKEAQTKSNNVLSSIEYKKIFICWAMINYKLDYPQAWSLLKVFDYNYYSCFLGYHGYTYTYGERIVFYPESVYIEYNDSYEDSCESITIPWRFAYNQDADGYNWFLKDEEKRIKKLEAERRNAEITKRKREKVKIRKKHDRMVAKILGL